MKDFHYWNIRKEQSVTQLIISNSPFKIFLSWKWVFKVFTSKLEVSVTSFLFRFTNDHEWNISVCLTDELNAPPTAFVLSNHYLLSFYFILPVRIMREPWQLLCFCHNWYSLLNVNSLKEITFYPFVPQGLIVTTLTFL